MNKRVDFLKDNCNREKFKAFEKALNKYNPSTLEKTPKNPNEIYQYYTCVDQMYIWLKNAYEDDLCVLCNEMRAILGHLSEYNIEDEETKNNLGKAYGHFRRLSIDTLKILCNGFDKTFDEWIRKHAYYDYRGIDAEYFPQYVKLYNMAHNAYIDVQKSENLGSDKNNNIIEKYYTVAKLYYDLYGHHIDNRRIRIDKITRRFKINKIVWVMATSIIGGLSVLGVLLELIQI